MTGPIFVTPREALQAMLDAGATFAVRDRADGLGVSFTYRVADGGDLQRCRRILAAVKAKPAPFFRAFQEHIQRRGGGPVHEEGALAPSTSLRQGEGLPSPKVRQAAPKREGDRA